MSLCVIHRKQFAEKSICPICKFCQHQTWSLRDGYYECDNCYKKSKVAPKDGEIWELREEGWTKIK